MMHSETHNNELNWIAMTIFIKMRDDKSLVTLQVNVIM